MAKKQTKKTAVSQPMSIGQLFIYVLLAIIAFWILGVVLDIAKWLVEIVLVAGLIVVIAWLLNQYWVQNKPKR